MTPPDKEIARTVLQSDNIPLHYQQLHRFLDPIQSRRLPTN